MWEDSVNKDGSEIDLDLIDVDANDVNRVYKRIVFISIS